MSPKLKLVERDQVKSRVCEIRFHRNWEHEARCLLAWKRREHPQWSQHATSYRVTGRKLRRVK